MATTPTPPRTSDAGAAAAAGVIINADRSFDAGGNARAADADFSVMLGVVWRLSKGYRLCPWRSPYLRWRIETYSGLHADRITARDFWQFAWRNRRELVRFLHWAEKMESHR